MGEVQRVIYVQPGLSPAEDEDDRLPDCHDSLRMFRICWNRRLVRSATSTPNTLDDAKYLHHQITWINKTA